MTLEELRTIQSAGGVIPVIDPTRLEIPEDLKVAIKDFQSARNNLNKLLNKYNIEEV